MHHCVTKNHYFCIITIINIKTFIIINAIIIAIIIVVVIIIIIISIIIIILQFHTNLFYSSLVSDVLAQCFKTILVTPTIKKRCLDHNDLNNRPISNLRRTAEVLENLSYSKFLHALTHTIA